MKLEINLILLISSFLVACNFTGGQSNLENYNLQNKNIQSIVLPSQLNEISGLAISGDNKVFCHDDEKGVIYQLNINNGTIVKRFQLGNFGIDGDFEGLAIANNIFYIITSDGILYKFREGKNLAKVKVKEVKLGFGSKFEIEGLCYDKFTNSLLLASKGYPGKQYKGKRTIFAYSLNESKLIKTPKIQISLEELRNRFGIKQFHPSAIEINPITGTYFVLSAKGNRAIIEIAKSGEILNGEKLNKKLHRQPEGLTFLTDGTMIISDEAAGKRATLTKYNFLKTKVQ